MRRDHPNRHHETLTRSALAVALVLGVACASRPPPDELVRAESEYEAAAADPEVSEHAPVALHEAEKTLEAAREAEDDGDRNEAKHLAYLATRRVEIAREVARRDAAQAAAQQLGRQQQVVAAEARAAELQRQLETLQARDTERGIVLSLRDVLFGVDEARLQPGVLPDLARLATFLREHPDRPVLIEGHTDSTGSSDYNLRLSEARAAAVENVLVQHGVAPEQISARGFGESQPIASNASAAGRPQNRRVEIVIAHAPQVGTR